MKKRNLIFIGYLLFCGSILGAEFDMATSIHFDGENGLEVRRTFNEGDASSIKKLTSPLFFSTTEDFNIISSLAIGQLLTDCLHDQKKICRLKKYTPVTGEKLENKNIELTASAFLEVGTNKKKKIEKIRQIYFYKKYQKLPTQEQIERSFDEFTQQMDIEKRKGEEILFIGPFEFSVEASNEGSEEASYSLNFIGVVKEK